MKKMEKEHKKEHHKKEHHNKKLMDSIKEAHKEHKKKHHKRKKHMKKGEGKIEKVMHEYKEGELHSGSKKGPRVSNRKQAVAIALSEARKKGAKIPKKK